MIQSCLKLFAILDKDTNPRDAKMDLLTNVPTRQSLHTRTPLGPVTGPEGRQQRPGRSGHMGSRLPTAAGPRPEPRRSQVRGKQIHWQWLRVGMSFQVSCASRKDPAAPHRAGPRRRAPSCSPCTPAAQSSLVPRACTAQTAGSAPPCWLLAGMDAGTPPQPFIHSSTFPVSAGRNSTGQDRLCLTF